MVSKDDAIKILYSNHTANISELKARQWDVMKWGALVNIALAGSSILGDRDIIALVLTVALIVTLFGAASIVYTQGALRKRREDLERVRDEAGEEFAKLYGKKKPGHTKFHYDWRIWGFQIGVLVLSWIFLASLATPDPGTG